MISAKTKAACSPVPLDRLLGGTLQEMKMQFSAQIQGGIGPDVWDKEVFIDAADFADAAEQASAQAEAFGGQVTSLDQCDHSEAEALDRAVNRFLVWPLPSTVSADQCACQTSYPGRYGTNLLTAIEAREMLRHVLGFVPPNCGVNPRREAASD